MKRVIKSATTGFLNIPFSSQTIDEIEKFNASHLTDIENNVLSKLGFTIDSGYVDNDWYIQLFSTKTGRERCRIDYTDYMQRLANIYVSSTSQSDFEKMYRDYIREQVREYAGRNVEGGTDVWTDIEEAGMTEDEVERIANKLGYKDGLNGTQAQKVLDYYLSKKMPESEPSAFTYNGIDVRRQGNAWIDSRGFIYMGYLTPEDIKQYIDNYRS